MSIRTQLRKAQLEISPLSGDTYSHITHESKLLSHEKNGNSFRFPAKRRSTITNNALNSTFAFLAYLTLIPAQRRKYSVILISKRCRFFFTDCIFICYYRKIPDPAQRRKISVWHEIIMIMMMYEKSIVLKPAQRRKIENDQNIFFSFSLSNSRINSFNIAGDEKLTYSLIQ